MPWINFWSRDLRKFKIVRKIHKRVKSSIDWSRFVKNPTGISKRKMDKLLCGQCIDCGKRLLSGPEGGGCVNVMCSNCGAKFNISPFHVERI